MLKRLIIGCGYLGQRVARQWLALGDSVSAVTRSATHAAEFEQFGLTPILADVSRPDSLTTLPVVDTVLWAVGWDRSTGQSQREIYVTGLQNVLQGIANRCSRLIVISSTSVYGQSNGEWVDESSTCEPTQPNGQVCLDAEHVLDPWLPGRDRLPTATVLRLSGIYGPGRLLSRVSNLRKGEPLTGQPDAWLNLIHVDDAATAVVKCAETSSPPARLLISDNEPLTRQTYYNTLAILVGAPRPSFDPNSTDGGLRTSGLNKRCQNVLARHSLNWQLQFPTFREGLKHAVAATDEAARVTE